MTRQEADTAADQLTKIVSRLCNHAKTSVCIFQFAIQHSGNELLIGGATLGSSEDLGVLLANGLNDTLQGGIDLVKRGEIEILPTIK